MAKRPNSLKALSDPAAVAIAAKAAVSAGTASDVPAIDPLTGSAISLRKSVWKLLRRVAEARSEREGGRPSVSNVIATLIDKHRAELEAELND